ncbi:MAG: DEAD/DEAH box helicase [Planctomycetes bacterium]|nr:DEAD/DEAH box helicase [Planctomycetota bacterium]
MNPANPLVVQGDRTVLLEVQHPRFEEARAKLAQFAELEKSPEHVHFYRITPISIWNAAALGHPLEEILDYLRAASRYPIANAVLDEVRRWYARYGLIRFVPASHPAELRMEVDDPDELLAILESRGVAPLIDVDRADECGVPFPAEHRGVLKHCLVKLGYPVRDEAGYRGGAALAIELRAVAASGRAFAVRDYQARAAAAFWQGGSARGGSGVVVLPCGAGKTVVGLAVLALARTRTLILTTNTVAVRQWRTELLDKTSLRPDEIGEYTGDRKQVAPITIATYQILTWRKSKADAFLHFGLLEQNDWGLIVYDEVHLLPAPVFRATAAMQARRRLGLTATLVREDGKEGDVFSLIGPKRFELPWRDLEKQGWLAAARCVEVRVPLGPMRAQMYASAAPRRRQKLAAENERKLAVVGRLLARHASDRVLVIGQYLDQLRVLAKTFGQELITGRTPTPERERLYALFREGTIRSLVVSKVGNFAIDLPDANVLVQVSGTFGSRQEEAQRLGRVLRPKGDDGGSAVFYSLVSDDTCDLEFSARRQLFLAEQGYAYEIVGPNAGLDPAAEERAWAT